jgi:hypothetical protein
MISQTTIAAVVFLGCISSGMAQQATAPEPYNDAAAYQIYSLLLPQEESYGGELGTLVIQEETVQQLRQPNGFPTGPEDCLFPEAARRFQDAISDYNRVNQKHWLLQRKFQLEKPYEIVNSDTLKVVFDGMNWDGFYKRYPSSGGILEMSAVGFNKEKTRAIVYSGSSCGSLCGSWSFYLFEKVDAGWRQVQGVNCHTVS